MTTPLPGGPLTHGHIPLPIGTVAHRPIERRNTSPFGPPKRVADPTPAQHARRQKEAAETLRRLDRRRAGRPEQPTPRATKATRQTTPRDDGPPEWVPRAVTLYQSGLSFARVAAEVGKHQATVTKWVKRAGITPRSGKPRPTFDLAAAVAMAATHTTTEIAAHFGIALQTLHKHLQKAGVRAVRRRASGPEPLPLDVDHILDLYSQGWTPRQIGDQLGCSHQTIRTRLRAAGVDLRAEAGRKADLEQKCKRDHPRTPENTGYGANGRRYCRPCRRITKAAWEAKRSAS